MTDGKCTFPSCRCSKTPPCPHYAHEPPPTKRRVPREIVLKPGWLKRQVDKAAEQVKRMPRWMSRAKGPKMGTNMSEINITWRVVFDILNPVAPAVENLACHQEQCDTDGCMVKVSRQAMDEVLEAINKLAIAAAQDALSGREQPSMEDD
jgi:hypothetical protein